MKCPNCGCEFEEGIFCPECGTKVDDPAIQTEITSNVAGATEAQVTTAPANQEKELPDKVRPSEVQAEPSVQKEAESSNSTKDVSKGNEKTYSLINGVTVEKIGSHLVKWFQDTKNMDSEGGGSEDAYFVQAKDKKNTLKQLTGMNKAIQIQLKKADDTVTVTCTYGSWTDKLGAGVVGAIVFAPLVATAVYGAVRQSQLPNEVFTEIEKFILYGEKSESSETKPVKICPTCGAQVDEGVTFCPECGNPMVVIKRCVNCGTPLTENEVFCHACGAKQEITCKGCGAVLPANTKFCPNCGTPTSSVKKICPNCKAEIKGNEKFCSQCGTALN